MHMSEPGTVPATGWQFRLQPASGESRLSHEAPVQAPQANPVPSAPPPQDTRPQRRPTEPNVAARAVGTRERPQPPTNFGFVLAPRRPSQPVAEPGQTPQGIAPDAARPAQAQPAQAQPAQAQ